MTAIRTRANVELAIENDSLPQWAKRRYRAFDETMTGEDAPYPCYFAVSAHRDGDLRYLFSPSETSDDGKATFAEELATYLDAAPSIADVTALAVFFEPPSASLSAKDYHDRFWDLLDHLHRHDPAPWPESIPTDPSDPKWEFCFAGEPIFLVARAPCYERRHSRYAPHGLEITVQPRWVFDGLGGDTEAGQNARRVIRDRLADYDDVPRHPDIGDYGEPGVREWKQYVLPDTNEERVDTFPFPEWST
ncbi:YqcI/YcgG family protein [Halegenticoccus soli]|uniref:YqcI/YcgG family protein n=1 Tax=Halegenticoccus soli TaxID=1985678 RepID=UPI000C6D9018|nr:YqcI/YcgG family protein [Halegenticoccus soli]